MNICLIGQPNSGKSSLFTRMTGVGVIASNYPGTTVEFEEGVIIRGDHKVQVTDLPGTFSLIGNSDDEKVVIRRFNESTPDCAVIVVDGTNPHGGFVLATEVIELKIPCIIAITKMDLARKRHDFDFERMSSMMGVPVMPVSSKTVEGVDALVDRICSGLDKPSMKMSFGPEVDKAIASLAQSMEYDGPFSMEGVALKLLENPTSMSSFVDYDTKRSLVIIDDILSSDLGEKTSTHIAAARHAHVTSILSKCITNTNRKMSVAERISDLTITPKTGIPILLAVCLGILAAIVYLGSFLDSIVSYVYDSIIGNALVDFGMGHGEFWGAVFTGIDGSIRAILSLVIPYIMVFYIILGILEDTGYLTRAVVLLDRVMHHFGLHGGSFIPMIVGLGCNVPAIMAVRTVKSRREKVILSSMIVMAVPCSAQIAIILGATGSFSGLFYAFMIFVMLGVIGAMAGVLLNRFLKYEPTNLAMEMPDLMVPSVKNILFKTWTRIKDFFIVAFPLLIVGSIIIELLISYDLLHYVVEPLEPITVGLLGLPAVTIISFIVGILRKEMALGMLEILAGGVPLAVFMSPDQFVVFGVVMAIYMPCIATLITMWKEIGLKETALVSLTSVGVALLFGTITNLILSAF